MGREDFKYLTLESERAGKLTKTGREMINSVVDFRSVTAADVMIPMAGVQTVSSGATVEELLAVSMPRDIDRVPVLNPGGEVAGLANVFEILLDSAPGGEVGSHQRRIVTLLPDEPASNVIQKLRASHSGLAVVVDRTSRPLGILTMEDLIGRLVKSAVS